MSRRQVSSSRRPYADQQLLAGAFLFGFFGSLVVGLVVGYWIGGAR
jgi:hypothetical protein